MAYFSLDLVDLALSEDNLECLTQRVELLQLLQLGICHPLLFRFSFTLYWMMKRQLHSLLLVLANLQARSLTLLFIIC